ncbi:hypothetical protein F2Q70_00026778 [Brassica cretica]|uniref:Uncharacterized protein n=1 Tax=Brassica cretica TaxID=69181 RepID=A0A8S9LHE0_BRACR|nr:hypothetical protein F2Q70_00026778 [Brassica cretica]
MGARRNRQRTFAERSHVEDGSENGTGFLGNDQPINRALLGGDGTWKAFRDLGEPLNHKECRIVSLATLQSPLIAGSTSVRAGSRSRLLHPSRAAASGMDLRFTAWDSYADKFESFWITRPYKEVNICILRVWRIDRELGSGEFIFRAVNNMSELLFNPPVVEAINAKHKLLLNPAFQCTEDGYNGDL